MTEAFDSPQRLGRQWAALLLAPVAWAAALGILFALTGDTCTADSRLSLWVIVTVCITLALASSMLAWRSGHDTEDGSPVDRARFMRCLSLGLSAMFSIVLMLMAVPILMLGSCRT